MSKASNLKNNLLKKVKHHILENEFRPGFSGLATNPFYFARKELYDNLKEISFEINGKLLDLGCGIKPYRTLFNSDFYVGLDLLESGHLKEAKKADVYFDGKIFPFKNETFDSIICMEVLEHVFEPDIFLEETRRVLKKGGFFLLSVPFIWAEHEKPFDYGRYTFYGAKHLLEKHNFEIMASRKNLASFKMYFQLINLYLSESTKKTNNYVKTLLNLFTIFPVNVVGTLLSPYLPWMKDFYLSNLFLAKKN